MEKNVFVVKPPCETDAGAYCLFITRGGLAAGSTAVFVDKLEPTCVVGDEVSYYQGFVDSKLVISFPAGTPFMLVERDRVELLTAADAAARQKEEEDAVNAVWKPKDDKKDAEADVKGYL